jgi:pyruvate,water dikinase
VAAQPKQPQPQQPFIKWFDDIGIGDVPLVGGKNASLGEMYRELAEKGVKVPNGFAITAEAYRYFLRESKLDRVIKDVLAGLDTHDIENLRLRGAQIRNAMMGVPMPAALENEIVRAYDALCAGLGVGADVAVRSSATAEDLPDASFAGQQETYLNVRGHRAVLETCRRCFASLFIDRAISYRTDKGFDHQKVALSVRVQRMVRADLASSGVMFTIDTESGFRDAVLINAAYGLARMSCRARSTPTSSTSSSRRSSRGSSPSSRRSWATLAVLETERELNGS